jgi:hypothetical protein
MMRDSQPKAETYAGTVQHLIASVLARIKTFLLPPPEIGRSLLFAWRGGVC